MSRFTRLLILIFMVAGSFLHAQNAAIRGFVYLKESGEPSIFTLVYLQGTNFGVSSDVNGYFSITKVPAGTYTIMVTSMGYDTLQESVTVSAGEILTKKLYLVKSPVKMKVIDISAEHTAKQQEVQISVNTITPKEIKQLPTVGGEPDLAQYLQVLPGVIFTGDQGGQLYIRGGAPIQNKVLLDGMIIYNPFHSIGLFSVFDADIMRNAEVHTGGFNAQYGGRISSVMDIITRDGNKQRVSGKVQASTFGAKTLLEGPLIKSDPEKPNRSSASYIFSAKTSYLPTTSKVLYTYVDSAGLPFSFTDLYGKVSLSSANGSKLNLFGFDFKDDVTYTDVASIGWKARGFGSNFVLVPNNSPVLIEGNFAYSKYGIGISEEASNPRNSDIDGFNLGLHFTYFMAKNEFSYGLEVLGFKTNFDFYNILNRHISQVENTTEIAAYLKCKFLSKNKKLVLEPGFRAPYYASLNNLSPEPRLGMKINITDRFRFKFASGMYSQNLMSATSDRDVVNLFYGFLSGSDNLQDEFTEKNGEVRELKHNLQKAIHYIGGVEYDLFKNMEVNLEAYRKDFTQLTNLNRNKLYDDIPEYATIPDALKKDFIVETGYAQGVDLVIKYDYKQLYLWAVYSLGFVKRWDGYIEYRPHFDRRHNINLVGSYQFGKGLNWEFDVRWNFGSGFPFTPTQGFYEKQDFQGGINTDYISNNGYLGILYGELNSEQLPYYHRLDLNIKRKWEVFKNSLLEVSAGASNVYNRKNIFYFNRITYTRVNQLPVMPSLNMSLTF